MADELYLRLQAARNLGRRRRHTGVRFPTGADRPLPPLERPALAEPAEPAAAAPDAATPLPHEEACAEAPRAASPVFFCCQYCAFQCAAPEAMRSHLGTHKGPRRFVCEQPNCAFRTASLDGMTKHTRQHALVRRGPLRHDRENADADGQVARRMPPPLRRAALDTARLLDAAQGVDVAVESVPEDDV